MVSKLELGLPGEQIGEAMIDLVTSRGYQQVTIAEVLERADVDRRTFDALFDGKQECFIFFFDQMADRFYGAVFEAFEMQGAWRDKLRAAAYAAARWMRDNPRETRYGTTEVLAAGVVPHAMRDARLKRCVAMIDAGREELEDPKSVSPVVAETVVGSIVDQLVKNLNRDARAGQTNFVPEFMSLAVRPYLGETAAREELTIPPPPEEADSLGNGRGQ